ncbi:MAG: acetate uptake transporter [Clostridiales Family XIII bacterium]|jgi:succinate-acetate transporter protein|nr:acetate uptake transporter [Clostridiales Family XIII bacterium]
MSDVHDVKAKANPGPLGLLGFGMTTVLLNLHNAGLIELSVVIVAMGFALGGLAQIIAGVLEFKGGNTFGGTAFTAYGLFWWSLVFIWVQPYVWLDQYKAEANILPADGKSMGSYLLLWGIFTLFMFIGTLKHNRATQVVFLTLTLLFFGLAAADFSGSESVHLASGVIGIVCGASAIYNAMGQVVNGEFGKKVIPLG